MPTNFVEGGEGGGSPSIMFVIDHSGSMSGLTGTQATDTAGSRFNVTRALIDTIRTKYPGAEVGMVIFQNLLYIDTQNQPYAVPLPSTYPYPADVPTQGYIPLLPLDSMLTSTLSVVDMLKGLLETKKVPLPNSGNQLTTDLVYKPLFSKANGYTNINTAFDAAKYAMQKSKYAKENQFIIFLSDGEPMPKNQEDGFHGNKDPNDYVKATDVPTTFTVYFVENNSDRVPDKISKMTENVRVNGYSANNYLSNVWGIRTSYDTLLNVLMTQAIAPIFTSIRKQPTKLVLNNVTYSQYSTKDSSFYVPNLALKDSVSSFNMKINYTIKVDSTKQTKDTVSQINFKVVRTDTRAMSQGIALDCSDTLFYTVNVTTSTANEKGPSDGTITFTRNNSDHGDIVVYFKITGTAISDIDYSKLPDSVVFTGSQKSVTLQIHPLADTLKEGDEDVIITLMDSKQGRQIRYTLGQPSKDTVIIKDGYTPKTIPDIISIRSIQNPFSLREDKPSVPLIDLLPQSKRGKFEEIIGNKNGILVTVFSNKKLNPVYNDSYGKAVLYDAVGNIVTELELQNAKSDTTLYGFVWDGTNFNHRLVGTGTYLMRMKVTNSVGAKKVLTEKLGVR
jgi:hypothetical protein